MLTLHVSQNSASRSSVCVAQKVGRFNSFKDMVFRCSVERSRVSLNDVLRLCQNKKRKIFTRCAMLQACKTSFVNARAGWGNFEIMKKSGMLVVSFRNSGLTEGVRDKTPLFSTVKISFRVRSKK